MSFTPGRPLPGSFIFGCPRYIEPMKTLRWLLLAPLLLAAGCGDNSNKPATPGGTNATAADGSPLNAPADYLRGLASGKQSAVKTVDTTSLDKAIQLFNVDRGRNPKDLDELAQQKYIPKIPDAPYGMKLVYDADAGTVKVVPQ
jgi:hypothetical protein